jgi:outer membrane immunogenic protein
MTLSRFAIAAALFSGISAAQAADLPPRAPEPYRAPVVAVAAPIYNWTGFYIGANGGYGWAGASASSGGVTVTGGDLQGFFAGGQVGFNYQAGMFVFGVEADGQWANIKETYNAFGLTFTDKINYFVTARGRLGVAVQNFLFYGTGGYAHVGAKSEVTDGVTVVSVSGNRGGWTAGGGTEIGFGNASIKFEYLYIQTFDKTETVFLVPVTWNVHVHTAKVGLNYRFGGGGPVVARY